MNKARTQRESQMLKLTELKKQKELLNKFGDKERIKNVEAVIDDKIKELE